MQPARTSLRPAVPVEEKRNDETLAGNGQVKVKASSSGSRVCGLSLEQSADCAADIMLSTCLGEVESAGDPAT